MDRFLVSDVHLFPDPEEHPGRTRFLNFLGMLSSMTEPGELWILGDLFDFWFEYGSVVPAGHETTVCSIKHLSRTGWKVHFIPGNHDFWVGRYFIESTGAVVHGNTTVSTNFGGRSYLLAHGDGLGAGDTGYRLIKPILRSRIANLCFRLLHPDLGIRLARRFSDTSKRMLHRQLDELPEKLLEWAERRTEEGYQVIVTGHTHIDAVVDTGDGLYVSLGDWLTRFTYCRVPGDTGIPELLTYRETEETGTDVW